MLNSLKSSNFYNPLSSIYGTNDWCHLKLSVLSCFGKCEKVINCKALSIGKDSIIPPKIEDFKFIRCIDGSRYLIPSNIDLD